METPSIMSQSVQSSLQSLMQLKLSRLYPTGHEVQINSKYASDVYVAYCSKGWESSELRTYL